MRKVVAFIVVFSLLSILYFVVEPTGDTERGVFILLTTIIATLTLYITDDSEKDKCDD